MGMLSTLLKTSTNDFKVLETGDCTFGSNVFSCWDSRNRLNTYIYVIRMKEEEAKTGQI